MVPKNIDQHRETLKSSSVRTGSVDVSSSSSLVRILRLLKHAPGMFDSPKLATGILRGQTPPSGAGESKGKGGARGPSGTEGHEGNIHLRPCFYVAETVITNLQRNFAVYPTLQGPASYSSVVREPFMSKESTCSKAPTIVFGCASRLMSLTEMPPNETCRLSHVRVVVRDVTGRFCWDLLPGSADAEGSEALCYHKTVVASTDTVATPGAPATSGTSSTSATSTTSNAPATIDTAAPASISVDKTTAASSSSSSSAESIVPKISVKKDRMDDLLQFLASRDTDASEQFGEFIEKNDPHQHVRTKDHASIAGMANSYQAQLVADQVHGLGHGTTKKKECKKMTKKGDSSRGNKGNEGNRRNGVTNVTLGAPESGCQSIIPAIQPSSLTSFDRCRQALAHVSLKLLVLCLVGLFRVLSYTFFVLCFQKHCFVLQYSDQIISCFHSVLLFSSLLFSSCSLVF